MADELNIATLALGAADNDQLDADSEQLDAVRKSVVHGDATAFVATLSEHKLLADRKDPSPLLFLMDWFHTWQQEYEAFVHVLEAEDEAERASSGSGQDETNVEQDLEEMEAEAEMLLEGFGHIAISLLDTLNITNPDSVIDRNGWTLLMQAANTGLRELVDVLVSKDVDVNFTGATNDATNPLYLAVESEHTNEAMVLLKNGAVASATKIVRTSTLAVGSGNDDNENDDDDEEEDCALFQACRFGHLSVIEEMIALGVDLNFALPSSGDRALHVAVMFEMQDVVELLLASERLEVNATNASDQTCLFGCSNLELARLLVAKGVDPKIADAEHETAFSVADALGDEQVAHFLKPLTA
ncbi:Ankyrin repeat [Globisporangium polare]